MIALPIGIKLVISLIWDALDFTIGRVPAFGTIFDLIGTLLAIMLWGVPGLISLGEVFLDPTDQIDGFIPTLTIIGIISYARGSK